MLNPDTTDGQLHDETAYSIIAETSKKGLYKVAIRKKISDLKTLKHFDSIRDPHLRRQFYDTYSAIEQVDGAKAALAGVKKLATSKHIRRLRCVQNLRAIPIQNKAGKEYKAYKGNSNWGIEIYDFPPGHQNKWQGEVISRFEANQKPDKQKKDQVVSKPEAKQRLRFQFGETKKPHPASRLIMRLQINDCIRVEPDNTGTTAIWRMQKVAQDGSMTFVPCHVANADAQDRQRLEHDSPIFIHKMANKLLPLKACKVHISPAGCVSLERRHKLPRRA